MCLCGGNWVEVNTSSTSRSAWSGAEIAGGGSP